jgi:hypothetical protein
VAFCKHHLARLFHVRQWNKEVRRRVVIFVMGCALSAGGNYMSMNDASQPAPTHAKGDQVRLVSQQPVEMAITGFDIARTEHPGYYIDTCDAADRALARVPARNAFSGSMEVFPEKPGEPITRVDVAKPRGAFTVVVPAPGDADHVSLVQVTPAKPDVLAPAGRATSLVEGGAQVVELARFPLQSNTGGGGQPRVPQTAP